MAEEWREQVLNPSQLTSLLGARPPSEPEAEVVSPVLAKGHPNVTTTATFAGDAL